MQELRPILTLITPALSLSLLAACGGGSAGPSDPGPVVTLPPPPTPAPTPTPGHPVACRLSAPTVDCSTRPVRPQALAEDLQAAVDVATTTPGAMYPGENRIYDLDLFRKRVVDALSAGNMCGAWDYGNERGDEIFVRSADGCVVEQYDLITGDGGVRSANKNSNAWQAGWGTPVPDPKPDFPRYGDLTCSLPGDRATFCFSIKNSPGEFGPELYQALAAVLNENPQLFDKGVTAPGGPNAFVPEQLVLPSWRIADQDGFIAAVEAKIRASGFCGYVYQGDILQAKKVSAGNRIHEEVDIVLNPPVGGSYVSFLIKDRCHNAGF